MSLTPPYRTTRTHVRIKGKMIKTYIPFYFAFWSSIYLKNPIYICVCVLICVYVYVLWLLEVRTWVIYFFSAALESLRLENFNQFTSPPLPLQYNPNQLPQMGSQDFEDLGIWDYILDDAALPSPFDYEVVDENPLTTMEESIVCSNSVSGDSGDVFRMFDWGWKVGGNTMGKA